MHDNNIFNIYNIMTTEWMNGGNIEYKESFENYKNIEMFQNIYTISGEKTEDIVEGFNIFGEDFNIHSNRNKNRFNTTIGKDVMNAFNKFKEFILCPFNKSDELIDRGIKNILNIFLAVNCNDVSLDLYKEKEYTEIVDLSDLIDPNLLYKSNESFQTKEGMKNDVNSIRRRNERRRKDKLKRSKLGKINKNNIGKIQCGQAKKQAEKDITKYSSLIRKEIYNIIFLPIIIHMFYNCYYMFFYKNSPKFIDVEEEYYENTLKPYFNYILGVVIKPVTWLRNIYSFIAKPEEKFPPLEIWKIFKETHPYVVFFLLYIIMVSTLSVYGKNIISLWGGLLLGTSANPFLFFAIIVMIIEFMKAFITELPSWVTELSRPISGSIKFIIYWIIRFVINLLIYPLGSFLCLLYTFVYLFFGVFISSDKDTFDVFRDVNDSIYQQVYKLFNYKCDDNSMWNLPIKVAQFVIKLCVFFLIELTLLLILSNGCNSYNRSVKNPNILAFLLILNFSMMFIIGIWCFTKYVTEMPLLNVKYSNI